MASVKVRNGGLHQDDKNRDWKQNKTKYILQVETTRINYYLNGSGVNYIIVLKYVHVLIPIICDYVTLHVKSDSADIMKSSILK